MKNKTISSPSNERVKRLVRLQKERQQKRQTVLVEGKKLLQDLVQRHKPKEVFVTENHFETFAHLHPTIITEQVAKKISDVVTPEGCFAEFEVPQSVFPTSISHGLILDGVQDPGNVGTLLRTALGFNIRSIFLLEPACDPWNPKAVRAAKASQFDLNILSTTWKDIPTDIPLLVADLSGTNIDTFSPPKQWLLVLGNEARGPRVPSSHPFQQVTIPMDGPVESLNVAQAGAILLYSLSSFITSK